MYVLGGEDEEGMFEGGGGSHGDRRYTYILCVRGRGTQVTSGKGHRNELGDPILERHVELLKALFRNALLISNRLSSRETCENIASGQRRDQLVIVEDWDAGNVVMVKAIEGFNRPIVTAQLLQCGEFPRVTETEIRQCLVTGFGLTVQDLFRQERHHIGLGHES